MGIFKSTDGGTTWKQLAEGLPADPPGEHRDRAEQSEHPLRRRSRPDQGPIGFYKSTDGGEHWFQAIRGPGAPAGLAQDMRPLARIGGGDLPTVTVDPKDRERRLHRVDGDVAHEDGGADVERRARRARRRRLPAHLDQPERHRTSSSSSPIRAPWSRRIAARSWSNWYNQPTAAMYHVTTDNAFPYRVCGGQQDSGIGVRRTAGRMTARSRSTTGIRSTSRSTAWPRPIRRIPTWCTAAQRTNVSLYDRRTGQTTQVGPDTSGTLPGGGAMNRNVRTMPLAVVAGRQRDDVLRVERGVEEHRPRPLAGRASSPDLDAADVGGAGQRRQVREHREAGADGQHHRALAVSPRTLEHPLGRHRRRQHPGDDATAARRGPTSRRRRSSRGRASSTSRPGTSTRSTAYAAANTLRLDEIESALLAHARRRQDVDGDQHRHRAGDAVANSIREDPRQQGLLYAGTDTQVWVSFDDGDHWQSLRHNMPAISVRDLQVKDDATCLLRRSDRRHARPRLLDSRRRDAAAAGGGGARRRSRRASRICSSRRPAVRVRFGVNDPTPWPPELPAGENPPPGALIDYYLREGRQRSGDARDSRRGREGRAHVLEHRAGARSGSGQGHGRVRRGLPEDADGRRTAACRSTGPRRSSSSRRRRGCTASAGISSSIRSSPDDLDSRRRRGGDRRGAGPHVSELQRAVGAAGHTTPCG